MPLYGECARVLWRISRIGVGRVVLALGRRGVYEVRFYSGAMCGAATCNTTHNTLNALSHDPVLTENSKPTPTHFYPQSQHSHTNHTAAAAATTQYLQDVVVVSGHGQCARNRQLIQHFALLRRSSYSLSLVVTVRCRLFEAHRAQPSNKHGGRLSKNRRPLGGESRQQFIYARSQMHTHTNAHSKTKKKPETYALLSSSAATTAFSAFCLSAHSVFRWHRPHARQFSAGAASLLVVCRRGLRSDWSAPTILELFSPLVAWCSTKHAANESQRQHGAGRRVSMCVLCSLLAVPRVNGQSLCRVAIVLLLLPALPQR